MFRTSRNSLHRPFSLARSIRTYPSLQELAPRIFTSRYLLVSLVAWTGVGAYFLFPPTKNNLSAPIDSSSLSPTRFSPVSLISSEITSKNTRLLTLAIPRHSTLSKDASFSPIWSIYIKDDDIQVERPYTPLEGVDEQGHIKLWVKKYPKGEVGRWLHSKQPGDAIEIRGPLLTWPWKEDVWDEIIMISGGTGITPFYQLLHHELVTKQSPNRTRFTLLHSSPSPGELPPPAILDPLVDAADRHPTLFRLRLFVDGLDDTPAQSEGLQIGRIDKQAVEQALDVQAPSGLSTVFQRKVFSKADYARGRKVLFLVCGPDPMITAIAGPWGRNFSQGRVDGILGEMGFGPDEVRKL